MKFFKDPKINLLSNSNNENNTLNENQELLEKLKNIANDNTDYPFSHGAMCYSQARIEPTYKKCKCEICKKSITEMEYWTYMDLVKMGGKIKSSGIAKIKNICRDCLIDLCKSDNYTYNIKDWYLYKYLLREYEKNLKENPNITSIEELNDNELLNIIQNYYPADENYIIVLFQPKDVKKPNLSVSSLAQLDFLLAFLENRRTWLSSYGRTILLRDNINIIERLTGLKL